MKKAIVALSLALLVSIPALSGAPAHAQARSEADCEKYVDAFAFNACLAELGPRVGEPRRSSVESRDRPANPVQRRPGGRKAATFDVITGRK